MKIALFFDVFGERGGAERIAIILAKHLDADIYTTYVDWNRVDRDLKKLKVHEIGLTLRNAKILTFSEIALRFSKFKTEGYDAYLFSRVHAFPAVKNNSPSVWISSGILDLAYEYFVNKIPFYQRIPFGVWFKTYRYFTNKWVKKFDAILANSNFTKDKIKEYYGLSSSVAYHPVETKRYRCKKYDDFYLMPTRLTIDKRVDLAIKAFKTMPEKRLVITGDGPEREKLGKLSEGCDNIQFLGSIDLDRLIDLYATCTATLSLGAIESWGLIPIESMASGKPCIASNAGGHKESIIHGKNGFLIEPTIEEIRKHVELLTPGNAKSMKKSCIKRAKQFDEKVFIQKVKNEIGRLIE